MWKSIKIKEGTKKVLDKLKVHPNQSYDEVIRGLIEAWHPEYRGIRKVRRV